MKNLTVIGELTLIFYYAKHKN